MAQLGVRSPRMIESQDNVDQFYRIAGAFRSKITNTTCVSQKKGPTKQNKKVNKINVLLVPDYSYLLQRVQKQEEQKKKGQGRLRRKSSFGIDVDYVHEGNQASKVTEEEKLLQKHSFIMKYLWDESEKTQVASRRYNIFYQQNKSRFIENPQQNEVSQIDEDQAFNQFENMSMLSLSQKKSSIRYFIKKGRESQNQGERPLNQNRPRRKSEPKNHMIKNKDNQDFNIDVWNSHGLKPNSNILKFGVRNKDIVIIVHHSPHVPDNTIAVKNLQDSTIKSNTNFVKQGDATKKWSRFVREVNKKCIIAHLYIREFDRDSFIDESDIKITDIEERSIEYLVDLKVPKRQFNQNNSARISLIVDSILDKQNSFPIIEIKQHDSLMLPNRLRQHSGIARYLRVKRSKSKNKERLDIACPEELGLHSKIAPNILKREDKFLQKREKSPKKQKMAVLSKQYRFQKGDNDSNFLGVIRKIFCCSTQIQQSPLEQELGRIENNQKQHRIRRNSWKS